MLIIYASKIFSSWCSYSEFDIRIASHDNHNSSCCVLSVHPRANSNSPVVLLRFVLLLWTGLYQLIILPLDHQVGSLYTQLLAWTTIVIKQVINGLKLNIKGLKEL